MKLEECDSKKMQITLTTFQKITSTSAMLLVWTFIMNGKPHISQTINTECS